MVVYVSSKVIYITYSVSQTPVLGPVLFIIYMLDVASVAIEHITEIYVLCMYGFLISITLVIMWIFFGHVFKNDTFSFVHLFIHNICYLNSSVCK